MAMISIEALYKSYGKQAALDGFSLEVEEGELLILIGPSGCGKSTLLKCVNRMVQYDSGSIVLAGRPVSDYKEELLRRGIGYCIQEVGLFPHMDVYENIAVVPRLLRWPEERIKERVDRLLAISGLSADHLKKYPRQLSGGEAQRVGVLRALASDPPVMLMDEPFGAVDPLNRHTLQAEFLKMQKQLKKTVVFVTHDVDEAILLADRIALMEKGRLVAVDEPAGLEARLDEGFIGDFLGREYPLRLLSRYEIKELGLCGQNVENVVDGKDMRIAMEPGMTLKDLLSGLIRAQGDAVLLTTPEGAGMRITFSDIKCLMQGAKR